MLENSFSSALVQMLSKVKVKSARYPAHKCFQTSPIIGRSEPTASWRGVTELFATDRNDPQINDNVLHNAVCTGRLRFVVVRCGIAAFDNEIKTFNEKCENQQLVIK